MLVCGVLAQVIPHGGTSNTPRLTSLAKTPRRCDWMIMAALRCRRNRRRCFQPRYACCIRKAARRVRRNSEMCPPQLKTTTCSHIIQAHILTK